MTVKKTAWSDLRIGWHAMLKGALLLVLVLLLAPAPPARADAPQGLPEPGWYTLTTEYRGYIPSVRGWSIEWQVPEVIAPVPDTSGALGQWFWNLETGLYYTGNRWLVYYYADQNGLAQNPACTPIWYDDDLDRYIGGVCPGWNIAVGQRPVFTYEYCDARNVFNVNGPFLCAYVNLRDGAGRRFLASDVRGTEEMYAHEVETFADTSGNPADPTQPTISCDQPITMVAQQIKWGSGPYQPMTGVQWRFRVAEDVNALYDFQNINLFSTPATWQACSPQPPTVCAQDETDDRTYWSPDRVYLSPDTVFWNRRTYQANWYTQGEVPGTGMAWQDLGPCQTARPSRS